MSINNRGCANVNFRIMAGTISIIVMLSTPTIAQAHVASDKSLVLITSQSGIIELRANELGVDIKGLSDDQAWKRVEDAQAKIEKLRTQANKLGIDIIGLTSDQLRSKIKISEEEAARSLREDQLAAEQLILQAQAKVLDINVAGLKDDEIRIKLETAAQTKQLATLETRAEVLNIDIAGLTNDQARIKIKAVERTNTLTNILAQAKTLGIGVDIIKKAKV